MQRPHGGGKRRDQEVNETSKVYKFQSQASQTPAASFAQTERGGYFCPAGDDSRDNGSKKADKKKVKVKYYEGS